MFEHALRRRLPSGLTILAARHPASEAVDLILGLAAGAGLEAEADAGLANLAARATLSGTQNLDFEEFGAELDSFGASLTARASADGAQWLGSTLANSLPRLLGLLRESLEAPVFAPTDCLRLSRQVLTSIAERDRDTMRVARLTALEMVYGRGDAYGRPASGYRETVERLGPEQLRGFWQRHHGPAGGILVLVGPDEPEALCDQAERSLGSWQAASSLDEAAPAPGATSGVKPAGATLIRGRRDVCLPGKVQTDIALACPGVPRGDPDFYALALANLVFGRLGMGGRVGQRVREQMGLAYYCYSSLSSSQGRGPWSLAAGVNPAAVEQALQAIGEELDRFRREPISQLELADGLGYARGSLAVELEEPDGIAAALFASERHGLGLSYIADYLDWLTGANAAAVQTAASKYLDPANLAIVTAGPPVAGDQTELES